MTARRAVQSRGRSALAARRGAIAALTAAVAALATAAPAQAAIPGAIDSRFGSCGQATGLVPRDIASRQFTYGAGSSLAAQPDGKIVAAGPAARGMGATRFNPDGSIDRSFGGDGAAFIPVPGGRDVQTQVTSVAVQPDGRVLAAGWARSAAPEGADEVFLHRIVIARFTPAGERDTSFSGDGLVVDAPSPVTTAMANAIAPADGGAVVVAGRMDRSFTIARYRDDGSLDPAFGAGGVSRFATAGRPEGSAHAVAVRPDGRVVVAGETTGERGTDSVFAVVQLTPSGQPDAGFGGTGIVTETFDATSTATALALLPDGRLYAVGGTTDLWGDDEDGGTTRRAAIVRYLENGARDTSFAGDGSVLDALGEGLFADVRPTAATVDPEGRLAIATGFGPVARYTTDGARDPSFGLDGLMRVFRGPSGESLLALPDGSLFVGGENDRLGLEPAGFEDGPAVLKLAGSGAALAAVENQPAACFLRLRNPTLTHMLRRRGTAPNGKRARNGTAVVALFLTQPGLTYVAAAIVERDGSHTTLNEEVFVARAAGAHSVDVRLRKAPARRLATMRTARVWYGMTTGAGGGQPVFGERTLRR
jgi:uncharacterized delta-60 repeat protein